MSDGGGMPSTAEEARDVLRLRWLVWLGAAMAVLCLMLATTSFQVGRSHDSPVLQWGAPVFFVLVGIMWAAGLRRLRARIAAARVILAREPGV